MVITFTEMVIVNFQTIFFNIDIYKCSTIFTKHSLKSDMA